MGHLLGGRLPQFDLLPFMFPPLGHLGMVGVHPLTLSFGFKGHLTTSPISCYNASDIAGTGRGGGEEKREPQPRTLALFGPQ